MDRLMIKPALSLAAFTLLNIYNGAIAQGQYGPNSTLSVNAPLVSRVSSYVTQEPALPGNGVPSPTQEPRPAPSSSDVSSSESNADDSKANEKSADPTKEKDDRSDAKSDDYTTEDEYKAAKNDEVARKQEYGQQTSDNTRQFLRTVTPLLKSGQWQFDTGVSYSINETERPAILGPILTEQQFQFRTLNSILGFRYGVSERLQWFGNTSVGWQSTQVSDGINLATTDKGGIGDLVTGFNYLLCKESECTPAVITTFDMIAPTGNARSPGLVFDSGTGIGAWAFSSDVLMVKSFDPIVTFWGLGYRTFLEGEYSSQRVKIGDSIQYNLGVGLGVNQNITLSSSLLGAYVLDTQVDSQRIPGSAGDLISVRLAATIIKKRKIVEPFVSFGLTDRAPDASLGVVWTR